MLTSNTTAVCATVGTTIRLSNNDMFDNTTGIEACGGTVTSADNNKQANSPGHTPDHPIEIE